MGLMNERNLRHLADWELVQPAIRGHDATLGLYDVDTSSDAYRRAVRAKHPPVEHKPIPKHASVRLPTLGLPEKKIYKMKVVLGEKVTVKRPRRRIVPRPGDMVKFVLASLIGVKASSTCGCETMRKKMNAWGWSGCLTHRGEIIAWFTAKAKEYSIDVTPKLVIRTLAAAWRVARRKSRTK